MPTNRVAARSTLWSQRRRWASRPFFPGVLHLAIPDSAIVFAKSFVALCATVFHVPLQIGASQA
eukprot:2413862-Lingulodinium_polyedra.AAC.1